MNAMVIFIIVLPVFDRGFAFYYDEPSVDIFDLTIPTTWNDMMDYYNAVEKQWKICYNCGFPELGTSIHYEYFGRDSMKPAIIPAEYLTTRLVVIDVSSLTKINPDLSLSLDVARRWISVRHDSREPTLLLFKFGWTEHPSYHMRTKCICQIPGLSLDLASWIAANLSHVVGVATDTPSLESEETREMSTKTVSNLLGRSGVYIIENVNMKRKMPEKGCLALVMPLKLIDVNHVPTRLMAFCAPQYSTGAHIVLSQKELRRTNHVSYRVDDDEIIF